jgi:ribonucleoside-diphosphate reductase alpha chain
MNRRVLPNRRDAEVFDFDIDQVPYRAQVAYFSNGDLAEIFLDVPKSGSAACIAARDAAITASLALQHGVSAQQLAHSLQKLADGSPAGPLGKALRLAERCNAAQA